MPETTLTEGRRREYLAALGIPLFQARRVLPGAAVSEIVERWVEPVPATPISASPVSRLVLPDPVLRPKAVDVTPEPVRPTSPEVVVEPVTPATPVPRFACRLMPLGEQGFVLLDLGEFPDVVAGEVLNLAPAEQQLWRNIQRALAWTPGEAEPDFIWPRAVKGLLGDDADTARDMLSAWLKRQIQPQVRLWVFGEALAPFVTRPHRLLPSLKQLLASPLAKRQVWQQLSEPQSAS
ncbi:hypothetical protein [Perlucidibaca aquatica]|uniref:hypothetical protein n=1 Tax=Perlucidibaca aquatica TaxID=1852776 RepID=UPI00083A340D|nr:hypothetical protein [Perlucidibaca aquatica]